jgi:hypothetical protein
MIWMNGMCYPWPLAHAACDIKCKHNRILRCTYNFLLHKLLGIHARMYAELLADDVISCVGTGTRDNISVVETSTHKIL